MMYQIDQPTILQESAEVGLINQEMLRALVIDQGPIGEAGRLFLEDGIKLDEIREIRIEFLNILNIDHLWVMRNLVKLKLCNNIIEKIENLEELIHLKELDLSFNRIRVMENLNHLTSLEILLLYDNDISVIEGIDALKNLTIFSIGANNIGDQEHVMYLREFKNLRSLNMSGNPCLEQDGYLDYLFAFLPWLMYFQYRMITDNERQAAMEKHRRALSSLEDKEALERRDAEALEAFEAKVALLSKSYVEYLDGGYLFNQMFARDKEGKDILSITDVAQVAFEEYRMTFTVLCDDLYQLGLKEQEQRSMEMKLFADRLAEGKDATQRDAQAVMDEMMQRKAEIVRDVRKLQEVMTEELEPEMLDEKLERAQLLSEEFSDLVARAWTKLMHGEVVLHDQIEDTTEVFKINMTDMVGAFLEAAQGYFSQMRTAQAEYNDSISAITNLAVTASIANETSKRGSIGLGEHGNDRDTLNANLAASHDAHLQIIDARETRMVDRLKAWLEEDITERAKEESDRHRHRVLEISHFLESQREEFDTLQPQNLLDDLERAVTLGG